jgi:hypothetical protein
LDLSGQAVLGEAGKAITSRWELLTTAAGEMLPTTAASGQVAIQLALQASTGGVDARSANERILDALTATLEKTASKEQQRYVIDGRELERWGLEELAALHRRYSGLVAAEKMAAEGRLPLNTYKVGLA